MSIQPADYPPHVQKFIDEQNKERGALYAYLGDGMFAHVTPEALRGALDGFPLELVPGRDLDWLALAIRRTLAVVTPQAGGMSDFQGNSVTRDNLLSLANRATALAEDIDELEGEAFNCVAAVLNDESWLNFQASIIAMKCVADTLQTVADGLKIEKGKWRATAARNLRVRQAVYLSTIFTWAFDKEATVNDRPNATDLGRWADFFVRVVKLADGKQVSDLRGVLKEARKEHKDNPFDPPSTLIPH